MNKFFYFNRFLFYRLNIKHFILFIIFLILIFVFKFKLCKITKINEQVYSSKNSESSFKIKIYGKDINSNDVTTISSYFLLKKSKHNEKKYNKWIENFFLSVSSPLVLFTDNKSIDYNLLKLRQNQTTLLYIYESHWDILKEIELKRNKKYTFKYLNEQHKLDPEKNIHNPNLYLIWNMKSYITNKIAQSNPFKSSVFIYTDSGAWRDKPLLNWPNITFTKQISNDILKNKILFGQITNSNLERSNSFPLVDIIEGTFFIGSKQALDNFEYDFWNLHDQRLEKDLFIGKDQTIMNLISFDSNITKKSEIVKLQTWNLKCKNRVDEWFFYQYYFANDQYYLCLHPKEKLLIN